MLEFKKRTRYECVVSSYWNECVCLFFFASFSVSDRDISCFKWSWIRTIVCWEKYKWIRKSKRTHGVTLSPSECKHCLFGQSFDWINWSWAYIARNEIVMYMDLSDCDINFHFAGMHTKLKNFENFFRPCCSHELFVFKQKLLFVQ